MTDMIYLCKNHDLNILVSVKQLALFEQILSEYNLVVNLVSLFNNSHLNVYYCVDIFRTYVLSVSSLDVPEERGCFSP